MRLQLFEQELEARILLDTLAVLLSRTERVTNTRDTVKPVQKTYLQFLDCIQSVAFTLKLAFESSMTLTTIHKIVRLLGGCNNQQENLTSID
jgi:hypothetical protein